MTKQKVQIVIPVYKEHLNKWESMALKNCLHILSAYPVTLATPEGLDVDMILDESPQLKNTRFPASYFKNIAGYNALMLSSLFYSRFSAFEYILIFQLDAFVFRDELTYWCSKNYDYIGAPWVIKPKYYRPLYRLFRAGKFALYKSIGKPYIKGKVGNGGFCLRKVDSFYRATVAKENKIIQYLKKYNQTKKTRFNEDVFWATENNDFCYPSYQEALRFAFDMDPAICLSQTNEQLPFGCHGWSKKENISFWKDIIQLKTAH